MSQALVTGGNGYLGTHLIAALLRAGSPVRTTVRSAASEETLRAAVRRASPASADDAGLEVVVADLTADDGWKAAVTGCEQVYHVASPLPYVQPKDPDELIVPAREGVLRVLRAARDAGARRVVLTSSFAAIGYTPKPTAEFTEDDWTDPDTPGLAPYPRSKAVAERAAWDLMEHDGGDTELVVVNPTFILGPTLTTELRSSLHLVKAMLDGTMTVTPRARFGLADVRDVADLHRPRDGRARGGGQALPGRRRRPHDQLPRNSRDPAPPSRPARRQGSHRGSAGRRPAAAGHPQRPSARRTRMAPAPDRDDDRGNGREPARPRPAG